MVCVFESQNTLIARDSTVTDVVCYFSISYVALALKAYIRTLECDLSGPRIHVQNLDGNRDDDKVITRGSAVERGRLKLSSAFVECPLLLEEHIFVCE